jgi:hypothetical protein
MLLAALGLGVVSWGVRRAREQGPAVVRLRAFGASIKYDYGGVLAGPGTGPPAAISKMSPYPAWLVAKLGLDFFHDVTEVRCQSSRSLTADEAKLFWEAIADLPNLQRLEAAGGLTPPGSIACLARHQRLRTLELRWADAAPVDYLVLAKLRRLETLNLSDTQVTDECLANIALARSLKTLDLHHARITDDGLAHVAQMPRLERLWLSGTRIGDPGVVHLRRHPSLMDLDLGYTAVSDGALEHLAYIPNLAGLDLAATAVSDGGLAALAGHSKLSYLNLESTEVRGIGLASLKRLPNLEALCLGGRDKLKSAAGLAGCWRLKRLKISCYVSVIHELQFADIPEHVIETGAGGLANDDDLIRLVANRKLKTLYVSEWIPGVPAGLAKFRKQQPDCELLNSSQWPDRGLRGRP